MSFNALKQSSAQSFDSLAEQAFRSTPAGKDADREEDPRFWWPRRDKAGNAYHVVRFLPAPAGEHPWAEWWDFGFQGPTGKWYFERSLRSIGQPDPVAELNGTLWKQGENSPGRAQASKQKQKGHYTANIQVISDGIDPSNNGKVFMWVFGKKIFEKIASAMRPEFPDEPRFNPFDLWTGANFAIKVRQVEGYTNYDKSEFMMPCGPHLEGSDVALEAVYAQVHSLNAEYKNPAKYKTYEALKLKMQEVLGMTPSGLQQPETQTLNQPFTAPTQAAAPLQTTPIQTSSAPNPTPVTSADPKPADPAQTAAGTATDPMAIFKQLAQQAAEAAQNS